MRSWNANLQVSFPRSPDIHFDQTDELQKGYRYSDSSDSNRSITFTQALLRCSAIEEVLACIVCNARMRSELSQAWSSVREDLSSSDDTSDAQLAAAALNQVLARVLSGEESVWFDIVSILLSPHGNDDTEVPQDKYEEDMKIREFADWVARCDRTGFRSVELNLIRILKRDWYDDYLQLERRELAQSVDLKRNQILVGSDTDVWQRTQLSTELVDLYESVRDNLDASAMHRSEEKKLVLSKLEEYKSQVEARKSSCMSSQASSIERQSVIKINCEKTETEFRPRLQQVMESRISTDKRIMDLEDEKRRLRQELERVSTELVTATNDQRECMLQEETIREELKQNRGKLEKMMSMEIREETEAKTDFEVFTRCFVAIRNSTDRLGQVFADSANELNEVYTHFNNAFVEAVQDHVSTLCDTIQDIYRQVRRQADELDNARKNRNSHSMTQLLVTPAVVTTNDTTEEFSASLERVDLRIADCEQKLKASAKDMERFRSMFASFFARFEAKISSNRLLKGEVDKVNVVFGETDRLLKKHNIVPSPIPVPASAVTVVVEDTNEENTPAEGKYVIEETTSEN